MGPDLTLALDFGGTKLTAATHVSGESVWHETKRDFSGAGVGMQQDLETMFALARQLLKGEPPAAIGVSFGGPVDFPTGTVRLSHHVPGWENVPLKTILETEFQARTFVDNDANVAALGEHRFGAGRGYLDICYLTVSTGVGGGWILNGLPWRGADGMAGEIGHTVVDPNGPLCLCGKRGCVERLASGPYMAADARAELETRAGDSPPPRGGRKLLSLAGDKPDRITGKLIAEAAALGDELALSYLHRAAWALGIGIGNAANLINPQRFILGGGVTKSGERFWETVQSVARQTALPEVHFDVVPAELGDDAPLWGAVALTTL